MKVSRLTSSVCVLLFVATTASAATVLSKPDVKGPRPVAPASTSIREGDGPGARFERLVKAIKHLVLGSTDDGNELVVPHP
jgi:hypothetical protein